MRSACEASTLKDGGSAGRTRPGSRAGSSLVVACGRSVRSRGGVGPGSQDVGREEAGCGEQPGGRFGTGPLLRTTGCTSCPLTLGWVRQIDRAVPAPPRRRRRWEVAIAIAAAALGASSLVALATADDGGPTSAAATGSSAPSTQASPSVPATVEESAPAPPQTVDGLIADLTARPDAAGPAGPLLRDGLQGLASSDEGVRQRSALQVLSVVVSGESLDPRYATASRLALFRTNTGQAPAPSRSAEIGRAHV